MWFRPPSVLALSCDRIFHRTWYVPSLGTHSFTFFFTDTNILLRFVFCWPCVSIYLCNKNQLDALFILSLFPQSTSPCFGHICSSSSGVPSQPGQQSVNWKAQHVPIVVYKQYTSWWRTTDMPETCRGWRNKLRINSASSWFSLHRFFYVSIYRLNSKISRILNTSGAVP